MTTRKSTMSLFLPLSVQDCEDLDQTPSRGRPGICCLYCCVLAVGFSTLRHSPSRSVPLRTTALPSTLVNRLKSISGIVTRYLKEIGSFRTTTNPYSFVSNAGETPRY